MENVINTQFKPPITATSGPTQEKPSNYIAEVRKLVAEIFAKLERLSQNKHDATHKLKQTFTNATAESAQLQERSGKINMNIGLIAMGVFCLRLGLQNLDDQKIIEILSQQVPNLGGMYQTDLQAQRTNKEGLSQTTLEEWRAKTGSQDNNKEFLQQVLDSVERNLTSASQTRG